MDEVFVPSKGGGHFEYYPAPEFEYAVNGRRMTSTRYSIAARDFQDIVKEKAEEILKAYPEGANVIVHVCPGDASFAFLATGLSRTRRSQYFAAIVGAVALAVFRIS